MDRVSTLVFSLLALSGRLGSLPKAFFYHWVSVHFLRTHGSLFQGVAEQNYESRITNSHIPISIFYWIGIVGRIYRPTDYQFSDYLHFIFCYSEKGALGVDGADYPDHIFDSAN